MAEQLNITNLELEDNTRVLLPDGDYRFTVDSHELGYATSDKMPPNTQQITCYLKVPYMKDGSVETVTIRNTLNVYKKALFAIRQYVEAIGMVPEKGKANIDLTKMDGKTGICSIITVEGNNGNEFNRVQAFYPPSKAPVVTANDEAWAKKDDFMEVPGIELPFD